MVLDPAFVFFRGYAAGNTVRPKQRRPQNELQEAFQGHRLSRLELRVIN